MKNSIFYELPKAEVVDVQNENSILSGSPYSNDQFIGNDAFDGGIF